MIGKLFDRFENYVCDHPITAMLFVVGFTQLSIWFIVYCYTDLVCRGSWLS